MGCRGGGSGPLQPPNGAPAAAAAALQDAGEAGNTPDTRHCPWKATHDTTHLAGATRLLDYRVAHAPAEYRESMLKNVRPNRGILEAWGGHATGDEA